MSQDKGRLNTNEIYQVLRERICLLQYPPGSKLRELSLAEEFRVSRTPIRTALQQLAYGGLIDSRDGVGNLVTDPDFEEIHDIYQMRLRVAELIGQMNPRPIQSADLDEIVSLAQRADRIEQVFSLENYWKLNHDLHFLIASIIGNSALRESWDTLYFQAARMWYRHVRNDHSGVAESMRAELAELRRAFAQNDALAVGYIQRNYIAYGLAQLQRIEQAK